MKTSQLKETGREDAIVDVVTPADIPAFYSSFAEDDDEEPLAWLPIALEIEDPEEAGWGHLEPNLNELPVKASSSENKENVSRKQSLSETNSTVDSKGGREGHPATKKTKVVDILLGSDEITNLTKVKVEPFVDVQSLDDDIDLPDLEGTGAVDKSDIKTENNTTEKDDTPTAAE